jgi:hypothetical protein
MRTNENKFEQTGKSTSKCEYGIIKVLKIILAHTPSGHTALQAKLQNNKSTVKYPMF